MHYMMARNLTTTKSLKAHAKYDVKKVDVSNHSTEHNNK